MTKEEMLISNLISYKQGCIDTVGLMQEMLQKTIVTYDQMIAAEKAKMEAKK